MATPTKIGTETIDTVEYEIYVSEDGVFSSSFEGDRITAPTKKALLEKLRTAVRSHRKVAIEVTHIATRYRGDVEVPEPEDLVLTGIHSSSRNMLYRKPGAKGRDATGQLSHYDTITRRLTKAEVEDLKSLVQNKQRAERSLNDWIAKRKIDARAELTKAAKAAAGEPLEVES